jgi:hypothetical protein
MEDSLLQPGQLGKKLDLAVAIISNKHRTHRVSSCRTLFDNKPEPQPPFFQYLAYNPIFLNILHVSAIISIFCGIGWGATRLFAEKLSVTD